MLCLQPGFAHVDNDTLHLSIEGFAFRLRPLGSASRTQRLFVSAAKQLTSLPRLPKAPSQDSLLDPEVELPPEQVKKQEKSYQERIKHEQLADGVLPESINPLRQAAQGQATIAESFRPRRSDTVSSVASDTFSIASSSTVVPFSSAPLHVLHDNLHTRLRFFFSQKLVGRRIRVSVYLLPLVVTASAPSSSSTSSSSTSPASEVCIARGTLLTEVGGVFKSSLSVPWTGGDPRMRKVRVRTELLSDNEDETIDDQQSLEAVLNRSDEASVGLSHAHTKIRVISDIDDTIKLTHVLAGIKAIMRNVFTRPHDELVVPGMQEWYWALYEKGASYVTFPCSHGFRGLT